MCWKGWPLWVRLQVRPRVAETTSCSLAAMGMVNAFGSDLPEIWQRLLAGDQSGFVVQDELVPGRSLLMAAVRERLPEIPASLEEFDCRNNQLALAALADIEETTRQAMARVGAGRVGVVVGTSTSGVSDAEEAIVARNQTGALAQRFHYAQLEFGGAAAFLAAYLGTTGPALTLSTACSSGARALASARSLLALGICDVVVAGAFDSLCRLTSNGFSALQAISGSVTNPCSLNRDGLSLGEAAVLFLVTRDPGGVQLVGVGESSEAHHMSAPDPHGSGAEAAMRMALSDAERGPSEVSYLNLHGTGTPLNDRMECGAVERVFGLDLSCSSTKSMLGHTLGTAGAMEAGFCWLMAQQGRGQGTGLLPHCWDGERDPELPEVKLARVGDVADVGLLMSNSFGFGGNNCTLLLEAPNERGSEQAGPIPLAHAVAEPIVAVVRGWAGWAPGLEDAESWLAWTKNPEPLGEDGCPDAAFIPAMLRRRCTPLSRIALTCAFACCDEEVRTNARTVFASRHGSVNESISMVEGVVAGQKISPARFSHTVHNAQAGLFSLAASNREASSSISASEGTFEMGWLEALGHLEREPDRPVVYVMADVPLSPVFAELVAEPPPAYGFGFVLASSGDGIPVQFGPGGEPQPRESRNWPVAAEFLRWLLGATDRSEGLCVGAPGASWAWNRPG
jgi:3-oxoacyl-[acyl-carrier-protein] synthase-1